MTQLSPTTQSLIDASERTPVPNDLTFGEGMTTPTTSAVHFRPGQHWLDPQGRFWVIMLATDQDRVETRQRGQTFSVWRPNTPPPGWRRLVDGRVPDLAVTPIHKRRLS